MLQAKLEGLDKLEARLNPAKFEKTVEKLITRGLLIFERQAKQIAPKKTGHLRKSISHRLENKTKGLIGPNVPYAAIQEFGGIIRPKNKKFLSWVNPKFANKSGTLTTKSYKSMGKAENMFIFAKKVTIKGKHYMKRTFESKVPEVQEEANKMIMGFLRGE